MGAQCSITVNAGPDQLVCAPSGTANLLGSVSGMPLGFSWSPAPGLSDPFSLTPAVNVTGPATYLLSAQAIDPSAPNLVTNPGFEAGNSGYSSQLTYDPLPINPGSYFLTTSPSLVISTFPPCDDHTFGNGTGNMFLANGSATPGTEVWCQTIAVAPNTWYWMSAWAMASPLFPPTMQFSVNGTAVGDPYPVGTGSCNWQQFSATWYSGAATTAEVCILDQISGGNGLFGDDFALDDIFFAAACTVSDAVNVGLATAEANSPAIASLLCNAAQTGIVLSGNGSSTGPGYSYQWSGPGILSGGNSPDATVNQEGTYTLTVAFDTGNGICTAISTTEVFPDPNLVFASAAVSQELNCLQPTVTLDGTGSSFGGTISYDWQPATGVLAGQGTLQPVVDEMGLYTLTVTNSISGCTAVATVFVNENTAMPNAAAAAPAPLSCGVSSVTLSGSGSSVGNPFSYLWTGPGIVSGAATLNNCVVNAAGTYTLLVTNTDNGCTDSATVSLGQSGNLPQAQANAAGSLDCGTSSVLLNSNGSTTGAGLGFAWTTLGGHFSGPTNGPTTSVDSAGLYILTITDLASGCSASDSVAVAADFSLPVALIETPTAQLTCGTDSVQLTAPLSSSGSGFDWVWASPNGSLLSGSGSSMPWVGSPGDVVLTVTDLSNGCSASDTVTVVADTAAPVADAGPDRSLDCSGTAVFLDGSNSSTGSSFSYGWTTAGGNIVGGNNSLSPEINGVGIYFLIVSDTTNGCSATDSVAVGQDANAPTVVIAPPAQLDCDTGTLQLDATGSTAGATIGVDWSGPGILTGQNTLSPTVHLPGVYQLVLTDSANHCEATASVTVTQDTVAPIASVGNFTLLDCAAQIGTLDGSGSSTGPAISYEWSTGATSLGIDAATGAPFILTVTNTDNGCTASDSVLVQPFGVLPTISIEPPGDLNCSQTQLQLSATVGGGTGFLYQWNYTGGGSSNGIVSGDTTLTPTIGAAGTYTLTVTDSAAICSASASVAVLQSASIPTADAGAPQTLVCGQTSLSLFGMASSGTSLAWSTPNGSILSGASTSMPVVNAPGTYLLTATDTLSGCTATDSVLVGQDAASPVADAGAPQTLTCAVQSAVLDGSGSSSGPGIQYFWTTTDGEIATGETTSTPTVTAPGMYLLTVTNTANNCQTLASVQVFLENDQPEAIATVAQPLDCNHSTTQIVGTGSSAGPAFTYLWTGPGLLAGDTTLLPTVAAPGVYTLLVTDTLNGCFTLAQITVLQDTVPPTAIVAAPPPITCASPQVQLDGSGSDTGAGFQNTWSGPGIVGGATTLLPTVAAPGTYALIVSNLSNGCADTVAVDLAVNNTPPTAVAAMPDQLDCTTSQIELDGTGSSAGAGIGYTWTGPGLLGSGTGLQAMADQPGTYFLVVENTGNGCADTAQVLVNQDVEIPDAEAGPVLSLLCGQDLIVLLGSSSTPGALFQWSTQAGQIVSGSGTASPEVSSPGVYFLAVTDPANGCASADFTIVTELTPIFPEPVVLQPDCKNPTGSVGFVGGQGGVQPFVFSIDGGANFTAADVFSELLPGAYDLVVQDATGCETAYQFNILPPPGLVASLPDSVSVALGGSVSLHPSLSIPSAAITSVVWSPATGLSCTDCQSPTATPQASTFYTVQVTSTDGCTSGDSIWVEVVLPSSDIYVPNVFSPNGDGINDYLTVFADGQQIMEITHFRVFSRWGETVFEGFGLLPNDPATGWDGRFREKAVDLGVYAWFAEVQLITGERRLLKGDVLVVR